MFDENLDTKELLSATQVAGILNVGINRISNWYKWYNDDKYIKPKNLPKLPEYYQKSAYTKRYWKKEDVKALQEFQKCIGRGRAGIMGEYNARAWQKRGERALKNKKRDDLIKEYFKSENIDSTDNKEEKI